MHAPPKWDTTPYCSAPPRRERCTAMAMDLTPPSCVAAIWCSRCTWAGGRIRWPNLAPVEVVEWLKTPDHCCWRAGSGSHESERFS
jgi:hypothetical protein